MIKSIETFEKIGATSSLLAKRSYLKSQSKNETMIKILFLTYNPYKIFNVGKVHLSKQYSQIKHNMYADVFQRGDLDSSILYELEYMASKDSIDDEGVRRMLCFFAWIESRYEEIPDIVDWLKRILSKDLKIGISAKTVNAVFQDLIPEFNVQLAEPFERPVKQAFEEPKYDGVRLICLSDIDHNKVFCFSRKGQAVTGYQDIEKEVLAIAKRINYDIMLDGEVIGENFDKTMNDLFSKSNNKIATYRVFDGMLRSDFERKRMEFSLRMRKEWIGRIVTHEHKFVIPVPYNYYEDFSKTSEETLMKICDKYIALGFEGAMIKDANSKYAFKRSYDWQKLKRFYPLDVKIIGFYSGIGVDSKYENSLGGVIIQYWASKKTNKVYNIDETDFGKDEVYLETSKCGSGFSDEMRDDIWNNKSKYLNAIIEVKYQEVTKDKKLRFNPVSDNGKETLNRIRLDK